MKDKQQDIFRRVYGIVLSAVIAVTGFCFMAACWNLYITGGEQPYSSQSVASAFSAIALPVYFCLVLVVGSIVFHLVFPAPAQKQKPEKQYGVILKRLYAKADMSLAPELCLAQIRAQQSHRNANRLICGILLGLGSMVFLFYALNGANFSSQSFNDSIIRATLLMALSLVLPFAFAIYAAYANKASILREIELVKQIPKAQAAGEVSNQPESEMILNIIRWSLVAAGVFLLVYGFATGGTSDVLTKAVNICTECVGLG